MSVKTTKYALFGFKEEMRCGIAVYRVRDVGGQLNLGDIATYHRVGCIARLDAFSRSARFDFGTIYCFSFLDHPLNAELRRDGQLSSIPHS